ncbi:ABC transporter permease [Kaistia sp. 32K]|uniref:ABC transporter permease n=1 Tax=Kaistia sp. 32K TaxID=2795690 RepID=UPI0019166AEB|nr:ABC transporter permease [Kaistia sp. 32K]BCP54843.1 ABC transporter permease [Kaistia sp. 32K]
MARVEKGTARDNRARFFTALLLAPMSLFLLAVIGLPLFLLVWESVGDRDVSAGLPRTVELLASAHAAPSPDLYAALVTDLTEASDTAVGRVARRLNIEKPGLRTPLVAARAVALERPADAQAALVAADGRWAKPEIWQAIRASSGPWTDRYLLAAFDLERNASGEIVSRPADLAIYRSIVVRSFVIAGSVAALCLILGLPLALYLASLPPKSAERWLLVLMLPLWTSILVRAMAWILLLQSNGLINGVLQRIGLISAPLDLAFNRLAVVVAMTHVLLPFMVLPIYNALRAIPRTQLMAAGSLGATPWQSVRRVYLPQARAGIAAGILFVLASAAGYYITPALVGGPADRMIGTFIELAVLRTNNPGLAAGLGLVSLVFFLVLVGVLIAVMKPMRALEGARG